MSTSKANATALAAARFGASRWWLVCLILAGLLMPARRAQAESEHAVKAAYLYNFTLLIKWPPTAFGGESAPLVVGVVGRDPFPGGLNSVLAGRKAGGHPLDVRSVKAGDTAGLRACQIVFVSGQSSVAEVSTAVRGLPVLVVGEADDFARRGGTIGFVIQNGKVKLEINRRAAVQARLSIPSDLLAISKIVES